MSDALTNVMLAICLMGVASWLITGHREETMLYRTVHLVFAFLTALVVVSWLR